MYIHYIVFCITLHLPWYNCPAWYIYPDCGSYDCQSREVVVLKPYKSKNADSMHAAKVAYLTPQHV